MLYACIGGSLDDQLEDCRRQMRKTIRQIEAEIQKEIKECNRASEEIRNALKDGMPQSAKIFVRILLEKRRIVNSLYKQRSLVTNVKNNIRVVRRQLKHSHVVERQAVFMKQLNQMGSIGELRSVSQSLSKLLLKQQLSGEMIQETLTSGKQEEEITDEMVERTLQGILAEKPVSRKLLNEIPVPEFVDPVTMSFSQTYDKNTEEFFKEHLSVDTPPTMVPTDEYSSLQKRMLQLRSEEHV